MKWKELEICNIDVMNVIMIYFSLKCDVLLTSQLLTYHVNVAVTRSVR